MGNGRTIFDLPEADFRRALGELKFNQRVAMFAKWSGASDEEIGRAFQYQTSGSAQKFIDKTLARVFELCDQMEAQREGSEADEGA